VSTYVAQSNLEVDVSGEPIDHPRLDSYFKAFKNGIYIPKENDSGYCSI
jgi:hemimethylated DNA binding protein